MELTKFNALTISKFIPPKAPKPKPIGDIPAREAPPPAMALSILGLKDAKPPAAEIKLGISPVLIA